ncbi:hypothetical protein SNL152K_4331 [Streptomyces sp. NL15-2K]|nr:hypothetical protein SNL152K_4331 [Streptomyces sp. NL15-2K]
MEQRRLDERVGCGALAVAEAGEQGQAEEQEGDRAGRPAVVRAVDEPAEQAEQGAGEQRRSPAVDGDGRVAGVARQQAYGCDERAAAEEQLISLPSRSICVTQINVRGEVTRGQTH